MSYGRWLSLPPPRTVFEESLIAVLSAAWCRLQCFVSCWFILTLCKDGICAVDGFGPRTECVPLGCCGVDKVPCMYTVRVRYIPGCGLENTRFLYNILLLCNRSEDLIK